MIGLTLGRDALSLADLVIDGDPFAGDYHLPEDGLAWPDLSLRKIYTSESATAPRQLLGYVPEPGVIPAVVYVHGDTTSDVFAAMAVLEAALTQWSYDVTITLDGSSRAYVGEPVLPTWGPIDAGMVRARMSRCTVQIPVRAA